MAGTRPRVARGSPPARGFRRGRSPEGSPDVGSGSERGVTAHVLDCETTGTIEPIEPIEVAWARLKSASELVAVEEFQQRYRPSKPIELGALAAHHIMDEDLAGCPPSNSFSLPPDATIIIGHNVDFDWKVIGAPRVRRIDVMAMTWKVWPELGKIKQGALLYHVDRARARALLRDAHSALQDVRNCLLVLQAIAQKVGGFESWEAMWRFSEEARVPTIMPFGKYGPGQDPRYPNGLPMDQVPADYKRWLLRQPDVDPYLRRALLGQTRTTERMA
jgi:exodeoxyribonuclease X